MTPFAAAAALTLALAGCATNVHLPAAQGAALDPIAFFGGRTQGQGTLDPILGSSTPIRVDSIGRVQNGMLVLDQTIHEGSKPPRVRRWTMRRVAPDRYTGTLTDAAGPVEGRTAGPRAFIRYRMSNGILIEQQLALQPDGRTVINRLDATRFGLRLATLRETIRKIG